MKTNINLWWVLTWFFFAVFITYTVWNLVANTGQELWWHRIEWVGSTGLLFTGFMGAMIAFYVSRVHKAQGGELPEDSLTADIDDGDPEVGDAPFRPSCIRPAVWMRGGRACRRTSAAACIGR